MALVLKFQKGGTYTYYGKKYDINDLKLKVYGTLDNFISSIKYGEKNRKEITTAVDNLMNGLESGRVTIDNNRLYDSEGEYHNADKGKHDAYGMATAHILLCMTYNIRPIKEEEEKKKQPYTPDVAGKWINKQLFNTESPTALQISEFMKIDVPENGVRSNTIRTLKMAPLLLQLLDEFDAISLDYELSPEDKQRLLAYIQQAIDDAKSENIFSENEYYNLSNALGSNYNWSNYFTTEAKRMVGDIEIPDNYIAVTTKSGNFYVNPSYWTLDNLQEIFNVFLLGEYGTDNTKDTEINDVLSSNIDVGTEDGILNTLKNNSAELRSEVKTYFDNNLGHTKILDAIAKTILLTKYNNTFNKYQDAYNEAVTYALRYLAAYDNDREISNGIFLFPYITNSNAVLAFDLNNNRLYWTSKRNTKAFLEEATNAFKKAAQNSNLNIISGFKSGGILRFDKGNKILKGLDNLTVPEGLPSNGYIGDIFGENFDQEYNYNTLLNNASKIAWQYNERYRNKPINGGKGVEPALRDNEYATNLIVPGNNEYDPEEGGEAVQALPWWNLWTNLLELHKPLAFEWAKLYIQKEVGGENDTRHFKTWFNSLNNDDFDKIDWNNFNYDNLTEDDFNLNNFANYTINNKKLWNDFINGIGHDYLKGRIAYINNNGTRYYYDYENLPEGYTRAETPDNEHTYLIDEYELTQDAKPEEPKEEPEESKEDDSKGKGNGIAPFQLPLAQNNSTWYDKLFPEGLAIGRLAGTLRSNNKAYRILNRALHPYLQDTYERYSPVTGEFGLMSAYNLLAADYNRLAARNATSDASINYLARLDANRLANQLREQGFLKDNDEIKRTATEALLRQEDNAKRWSETANANRENINNTNYLKAALAASHQTQNWATWDNYLAGIEKRLRTKQEEKDEFYKTYMPQLTLSNARIAALRAMLPVQLAMYEWQKKNPGMDIEEWDEYPAYLLYNNEISNWLLNVLMEATGKAYGMKTSKYNDLNTINHIYRPSTVISRKGSKLIKRKFRK